MPTTLVAFAVGTLVQLGALVLPILFGTKDLHIALAGQAFALFVISIWFAITWHRSRNTSIAMCALPSLLWWSFLWATSNGNSQAWQGAAASFLACLSAVVVVRKL